MLPQTQRQPIFIDDATYATRFDYDTNGNIVYQGWAEIGSASSSAVWRIRKFTYSTFGSSTLVVASYWADGDTGFNNVWDNRASLSYS